MDLIELDKKFDRWFDRLTKKQAGIIGVLLLLIVLLIPCLNSLGIFFAEDVNINLNFIDDIIGIIIVIGWSFTLMVSIGLIWKGFSKKE